MTHARPGISLPSVYRIRSTIFIIFLALIDRCRNSAVHSTQWRFSASFSSLPTLDNAAFSYCAEHNPRGWTPGFSSRRYGLRSSEAARSQPRPRVPLSSSSSLLYSQVCRTPFRYFVRALSFNISCYPLTLLASIEQRKQTKTKTAARFSPLNLAFPYMY